MLFKENCLFLARRCIHCTKRFKNTVSNLCLCLSCHNALKSACHNSAVTSTYMYTGIIRSLLLRSKVKSDLYAMQILRRLWHDFLQSYPAPVRLSAVVPAPSSLWDRVRGRFDLGWWLARDAAAIYKVPLLKAPRSVHFNLTKQAQRTSRQHCNLLTITTKKDQSKTTILIVDDVITSGETLRKTALIFQSKYNICFFTLAAGS